MGRMKEMAIQMEEMCDEERQFFIRLLQQYGEEGKSPEVIPLRFSSNELADFWLNNQYGLEILGALLTNLARKQEESPAYRATAEWLITHSDENLRILGKFLAMQAKQS